MTARRLRTPAQRRPDTPGAAWAHGVCRLPAARRRPGGFTLVEMLVATALSGMLLAALWMLMSTYGELFDKGQRQVEQAQLSRALLEQIADDLRSAIQDPLPSQAGEAAGAGQRRRFGLFGTSRELRFDVLQLTPQLPNPVPVGQAAAAEDAQTAPRVPELRTVHYTFLEPATSEDGELSPTGPQGLVRTELDFETPLASDPTAARAATGAAASADVADLDLEPADEPSAGAPEVALDDTRLEVPEVASVQFRYFDGRGWSDAWNSLDRKALPAAVAVELQLTDWAAVESERRPDGDSPAIVEPALPSEGLDAAEPADDMEQETAAAPPVLATYRLVVDLPGSPNYRPAAVEPPPADGQPARVPVRLPARVPERRVAPPRWTRPAETPALPEDWLRTGKR